MAERERLTEAVNILSNIVNTPTMVSSLSDILDRSRQSAVNAEVRRLFRPGTSRTEELANPHTSMLAEANPLTSQEPRPRFQNQHHFGRWTSKSRKRPAIIHHPTFNKDLILLPRSTWKNICKHKTKRRLHEGGCIISAFEINKSWDYKTVISEIKEAFKDKIPDDTSVELLMPCGSNLVQPRLRDGQELNGFMIHKIFRAKSMYIRPSSDLPLSLEHTDSEESSMELDAASASSHHSTTIPSQRSDEMNTTARGNRNSLTQDLNYPPTRRTTIIQSSEMPPESTDSMTTANQLSAAQPECIDIVSTVNQTSDSCDNYATYISLMSSISDLSSDEEELNLAIMASLQNDVVSDDPIARSAKEILLELASQIDASQRCRFNINRSSVLDGALRGFRRLSYNPRYQMCIKFSDDLGLHEEAVDLGGPRREFLHLLMEAIAQSPMFEGRDGNLNLALDSSALREDRYFIAGQAIAVSLVNGGPPPGFFSSALYSRLIGGSSAVKPVLSDIADNDLHDKVQKMSECTSIEELIKTTEPLHDYLANSGCLRHLKTINDKDLLVQDILMFQVVHRVTGAFERFRDGLKTLGVLDAITTYPESFKPLMCYEPPPLTAEIMDKLFSISLSSVGSNKRRAEERIIPFWRDYLQDVEEQEGPSKLGKILAFATGATVIPPVGFSPQPSIEFLHEQPIHPTRQLPMANTCINCLKLPMLETYHNFKESMDFALENTHGFGRE